jgi:glycosyltransferase involved in cell wall biosynthesis
MSITAEKTDGPPTIDDAMPWCNPLNIATRKGKRPIVMFLGLRGVGNVQGGVETHVTNLILHLPIPPDRMEVIGRAPYREGAETDPRLPKVRWLPAFRHQSSETVIHTFLGVCYAALRRPALLHIHGIGPNLMTPLARLLGLKVVATHHGADYAREKWGALARRMLRAGEREAVERSEACISISPTDAADLRRRYDRDVTFIPNGIDMPTAAPAGETLRKYGITASRYIINVARLVPEKRQLDLIDAFARAEVPDDVHLVLVGGADHESQYVRAVRERAAMVPRIIMPGHVSGQPLAELFSNAGVFALPSTHEGLPIALLEAMAYGRALVLSDLPVYRAMGLPETCQYVAGDIDGLAGKLTEAFVRTSKPEDWSAILVNYRWDHVARDTMEVYARVLNRRS